MVVRELTMEEVEAIHQEHFEIVGAHAPESQGATPNQLMILRHLVFELHKAPFVDFAVWGPYDDRMAKEQRTDAQVFIGNTLVSRKVHDPADL